MRRLAVAAVAALVVAGALAMAVGARPGHPSAQSDPTAACAGDSAQDYSCHARRLVALTERSGARAALLDLKRGLQDSRYLRDLCHPLVHQIGRTAGKKAGMNAFADGDAMCSSGYYHGVTEQVMTQMRPREALDKAQ